MTVMMVMMSVHMKYASRATIAFALALGISVVHITHVASLAHNHASTLTAIHACVRGCSHSSLGLTGSLVVEKFTQPPDSGSGENTEDIALVVVKLRRCFSAEGEEIVTEEGLDPREREMGQFRAVG